jgi:hypothetical protein
MTKRLALVGSVLLGLAIGSVGHAQTSLPKPLLTVKPEKGYVDDAMTLTDGGAVFLYVNTDGTKFATLRGVALPPGRGLSPQVAAPPAVVAPPPPPPAPAAPAKGGKVKAPPVTPPAPRRRHHHRFRLWKKRWPKSCLPSPAGPKSCSKVCR